MNPIEHHDAMPCHGLGDGNGTGNGTGNGLVQVYIANIPDYQDFHQLTEVKALQKTEIESIGNACGNGWRKVFNVYAKLLYALVGMDGAPRFLPSTAGSFARWQDYRDQCLLQADSHTSLLFSQPILHGNCGDTIRIVMGRTYAKTLNIPGLVWLNEEFAISKDEQLIVCPYFDYRQLSNIKIIYLCDLIIELTRKQ